MTVLWLLVVAQALLQPPAAELDNASGAEEEEKAAPPEELPAFLSPEIVELFEAHQTVIAPDGREQLANFQLFTPPQAASGGDQFPLIVWLHGKGESGDDNVAQLRGMDLVFESPNQPDRYPFFLVATQCPGDDPRWYGPDALSESSDAAPIEPLTEAMEIVKQLLNEYPIDPNRIYLSGVSSGGTACWEMAIRFPGVFAAVAPFASSGGDTDRVERIAQVPVWTFHSAGDSPERVRSTISALKASGGRCHLTEVPGASHNCWATAFRDYDIIEWLLAQRKGQAGRPPGVPNWGAKWRLVRAKYLNWAAIAPRLPLPLGLVFAAVAWRFEQRRRTKRASELRPSGA